MEASRRAGESSGISASPSAKCSNHLCTSATISVLEPVAGRVSSVTVGSDGLPVVAYYGAAGLRVRKCGDAQCLASTAVTLAAGLAPTDAVALGCGDMDMPVLTFRGRRHGEPALRELHELALRALAPQALRAPVAA